MSGRTEREKRRSRRLEEEGRIEADERRRQLLRFGGGAALLALLVVAVLIIVSQNQGDGGGGGTDLVDVDLVHDQLQGIPQSGTRLGEPDAPVTLIEFGDLQCPVCAEYSEKVLPQIIAGPVRQGRAAIEFRNYTIIGRQSIDAGAAALAAGEQKRGWNFIELFYRNQGEERSGYVTDDFLAAVARGAGVPDMPRWQSDRRSRRLLREVGRTYRQAGDFGFDGTPSFVVKGPRGTDVLGTPGSAEAIEKAIDAQG